MNQKTNLRTLITLLLATFLAGCQSTILQPTENQNAKILPGIDDTAELEVTISSIPESPSTPTTIHPTPGVTPGGLTDSPPADTSNEIILIFSLNQEGETSAINNQEAYEQAVLSAVINDLALRLAISETAVTVNTFQQAEIQSSAPCAGISETEKTDPIGDGLSIGYEVQLTAEGLLYQYVAVGGLAYFCQPQ